jgi:hypothetical protein
MVAPPVTAVRMALAAWAALMVASISPASIRAVTPASR